MRKSTFVKGSTTFICDCCGHNTRWTGEQSLDAKICPICWDLAGIQNMNSDYSEEDFIEMNGPEQVRSCFADLKKRSASEFTKAQKSFKDLVKYLVEDLPVEKVEVAKTRKTKYEYAPNMTAAQKKALRTKLRKAQAKA